MIVGFIYEYVYDKYESYSTINVIGGNRIIFMIIIIPDSSKLTFPNFTINWEYSKCTNTQYVNAKKLLCKGKI